MRDALRLALGTLTVLPVRPPGRVDRRTAGEAMLLAPLVGLLLAAPVLAALWLLGGSALLVGSFATPHGSGLTPLVAAVAVVGLLALLTRGLHLDGLADTADGLGSGRPAAGALAVMRRSDVGPFGVVTLLLVLLLQVAALQALLSRGQGAAGVVTALVVSRLVLPLICSRGVPAARTDGLGSTVAGSVSRGRLLVAGVLGVAALALLHAPVVTGTGPPPFVTDAGWAAASVLGPVAAAALLARRCVRRLGGVTGDVLGACVEVAFTTALLIASLS